MNKLIGLRWGLEAAWVWFANKAMECVSGKRAWGKEKSMKLMSEKHAVFPMKHSQC